MLEGFWGGRRVHRVDGACFVRTLELGLVTSDGGLVGRPGQGAATGVYGAHSIRHRFHPTSDIEACTLVQLMLPPLACLRINAPTGMPPGPPGKKAKPNEPEDRESEGHESGDRESEVPPLPPELRELIAELQDASYPQPPLLMTNRDLVYTLYYAFAKEGGISLMVEGVRYELWEAVKLSLENYLRTNRHGLSGHPVSLINRVGADKFRRNLRAPNLGAITRETRGVSKPVGWHKGNGWYYPQNYEAAFMAWLDFLRNNKELPPSDPLVIEAYDSYKWKCQALDRRLFKDLAVAMWEWYRVGIDPGVFQTWTVLMWLFAARSGLEFPMDQQGRMSQPPDAWYQQGPS